MSEETFFNFQMDGGSTRSTQPGLNLSFPEATPVVRTDLFDELGEEIHPTNVKNGFWDEPEMMDKYVAKIALIHSELSELLEALRKGQGSKAVTEEESDVIIRLLDLHNVLVEAGEADPNLYAVTKAKMRVNRSRPPKHGNRWG